jgi:hypothetical protein
VELSRHALDKLDTYGIRTMDQPQHLSTQLEAMERVLDNDTGAILFRHPTLRGWPGCWPMHSLAALMSETSV